MLKAGYVLCHKCGTASDEAIYFNGEINIWLQLKRSASGRFFVERYIPEKIANNPDDGYFRFELSEDAATSKKGIPHSFEATCYLKRNPEDTESDNDFVPIKSNFTLCCPHCKGAQGTMLLPGLGNLPTYVIAVVGARTVGKSSWINSVTCPENIIKVSEPAPVADGSTYYALVAREYTEATNQRQMGTLVGDIGETNILTIIKKNPPTERNQANTQAIANILLVDFAGEVFAENKSEEFKEHAAHFFSGGVGYNGVDAVLFVTDPDDERRVDQKGNSYSVATTFNRVYNEMGLLNGIPFAFIINKVDLLFEKPSNERSLVVIDNPDEFPEYPLVSASTFGPQNSAMYRASNLLPRIALETHLSRKLLPTLAAVGINTRCAGFLVKTAEFDEEQNPDYSKSINVLDPLLWVLNELDIYPIN